MTFFSDVFPRPGERVKDFEVVAKARPETKVPAQAVTPAKQALLARVDMLECQLQARQPAAPPAAVVPPPTSYYPPAPQLPPPAPSYCDSGYDSSYYPSYIPTYYPTYTYPGRALVFVRGLRREDVRKPPGLRGSTWRVISWRRWPWWWWP